ncbi:hypothetical protein N802_08245 [Knoellia sinensis KCTC 19936]|uniref:Uncharacterized protein n=1 Tax=Knoellia sinensis KCTC 19936 TaxID=1385520 RepID=A0A0A0JED6_9MICO|nr:hypothetical protein [Knoellia sinensis]KGN33961.1 hypothetical protein N802_08245 [Knoellia sinensis KCTC 19936]
MSAASAPVLDAVPQPAAGAQGVVRTLTRIEVGRLLRQPVFIIAVLLFVLTAVMGSVNEYANADYVITEGGGTESNLDWPVLPAFMLGLGGLIAMNRVTKGASRAGDVVLAAPASAFQRSLALCLACLVPAGIALLAGVFEFTRWMVDPPVQSMSWGEFTSGELAAIVLQGVLAALGGPLLGVAVARWWRWPTAGAITAVGLILWSVLSGVVRDTSVWERLLHHTAPFTLVAYNTEGVSWTQGGNHYWRFAYLVGLCLLAAIAACAHGSTGELRRTLVRAALIVGGLTILALALTVLTGQVGHYGPWDPRWTLS